MQSKKLIIISKTVNFAYELFFSDWSLVAEKKECGGSETNMGWKRTVADCANACRGKASMFTYGTNDFGTNKCLLPCRGCKCFCETASSSGTCNEELNHDGFRLYKYENDGSKCFIIHLNI